MGSRFRILHVFRSPVGGLFRHVLDLARAQVEAGHEVGVFCDSSTGSAAGEASLATLARDLSLGLHRASMRRSLHPLDLRVVADLNLLTRRLRPNVLHGHGAKGGAFARLASGPADEGGIRAYTPHGGSFHYAPGTVANHVFMRVEALLARRTDLVLFESAYVKARFDRSVGRVPAIVKVVHNGLAEAEFAPVSPRPDPFDLLYIGELRQAKGIHTLVDALGIVRRDSNLRLTLLIVGAGPSEAELAERVKSVGIYDSVAFVPPQPIRAALERANVMVVPSLAESLPYVILEAAAAGQPLIATNVGGIPEIFGPFADRLIPPGDPVALARAIEATCRRPPAARAKAAAELREHVHRRFAMERMRDGVLSGYAAAFKARAAA